MEFQQQPFTPPPTQQSSYTPPVSAVNPVVRSVKEIGRSPLFLVICLLQTAVAVATLAVSFAGIQVAAQVSADVRSSVEISVFPILFAVALWVIRYACCSDDSPFISTGGLKFVKVITTIQLVMYYIVAAFLPIFMASLLVSQGILEGVFGNSGDYIDDIPSGSPAEGIMSSMFLAFAIVLFIAVVFMIVFTHVLRKGIETFTENCEGYLTDRSVPMFLVVACYMIAGFQLVGGLGLLSQPLLAAVVIANGAVFVLGGVLLAKYRKVMEELRKTSMESAYFSAPTPPPFQNM